MSVKQIVILLVVVSGIVAPDITFGFEIVSTTTERDIKDSRYQQEIMTFRNTLQEQQNFWIRFYNDSCESRQTQKEQLFAKKMEETSNECGKKQKELMQHFNEKMEEKETKLANTQQEKQKELLKHFDEKIGEIENKLTNIQQEKQKELLQHFDGKIREIETKLTNIHEEKQNELLVHFDKKIGEIENKLTNTQEEKQKKLLQHYDDKMVEIETKFVDIQQKILKQFVKGIEKSSLSKNCMETLKKGHTVSGVYTIQPINTSFEVWCDMNTRDGGWTYVLNRFDGSQDFYLDWSHYRNGFGDLSGEFWLGLERLYELTRFQNNQLLIEFVDWDNKKYHAMYNVFRIGSEEEGYPIKVLDGFSGDAGDSLTYHKNMKFSTYDKDQDQKNSENCARTYHGAWWYNSCYYSNLAGTYFNTAKGDVKGMVWYHLKNDHLSLKKVKMMVKPNYL